MILWFILDKDTPIGDHLLYRFLFVHNFDVKKTCILFIVDDLIENSFYNNSQGCNKDVEVEKGE